MAGGGIGLYDPEADIYGACVDYTRVLSEIKKCSSTLGWLYLKGIPSSPLTHIVGSWFLRKNWHFIQRPRNSSPLER